MRQRKGRDVSPQMINARIAQICCLVAMYGSSHTLRRDQRAKDDAVPCLMISMAFAPHASGSRRSSYASRPNITVMLRSVCRAVEAVACRVAFAGATMHGAAKHTFDATVLRDTCGQR